MKKLFEPTYIKDLKLKNRFVRSATWECMATEEGHLTDKLYKIYEDLAKNDIGLIITGYANIVKEEQPNKGMIGIYNDSFIDEYKKLTSLVHSYDSKIILQICYGGTKTKFNVENRTIFAPSSIAQRDTKVLGTEMTKEDIKYIIEAFAKASKRAYDSGFDGVEIHGAHSYLINQFLSPYYNKRKDEYGGNLENRMRFLTEICKKTRSLVSNNFKILVKLTATEFFQGGLTFDETKTICKRLESIGIDCLDISGNIHGKAKSMVGQKFDGLELKKEGFFIEYAKIISNLVNIPVMTVGGFNDFNTMEDSLNSTNIDLFALCRPLIREPDLIKKWKKDPDYSCLCIRCSKCRHEDGNYCIFN
ncbi:NADH:flavin oxidoreductase [Clostridium oceanicum]|uniref:NADH:flavin oxidoreductase n=1 Tax=Clostridium oceanicum TaxID=1543 RepID=A0ABP3UN20_9CLOT